jgi:hypothetical protein
MEQINDDRLRHVLLGLLYSTHAKECKKKRRKPPDFIFGYANILLPDLVNSSIHELDTRLFSF